jgi:AcrR family transcriptional regulator
MVSAAGSSGIREQRAAKTRGAVLDAAIALFSEHGCEGTPLRNIAERCGIKQSLILYHFENKDALFKAAIDEVCRRMETTLFAWVQEHGVAVDASGQLVDAGDARTLRVVLRAFVQAVSEHPEYLQMLLREGSHRGTRFDWLEQHHTGRNFRLGTAFFASLQQRGLFADVATEHLIYILAGATTFIFAVEADVQHQTGRDPRSAEFLDAHIDTLAKLLGA